MISPRMLVSVPYAQNPAITVKRCLLFFIVPSREAIIKQCQATSSMGIEALEALIKQAEPVRLEDEVLFALLVYTDETTTWGSPQTKASAAELLEQQLNIPGSLAKEQFITESILQNYLRPLFSKSKPSSITASGRKAEYQDTAASRGEGIPDDSALTKPWKYTDLRAIPAMGWAVREADVSTDLIQHSNSDPQWGIRVSHMPNSKTN